MDITDNPPIKLEQDMDNSLSSSPTTTNLPVITASNPHPPVVPPQLSKFETKLIEVIDDQSREIKGLKNLMMAYGCKMEFLCKQVSEFQQTQTASLKCLAELANRIVPQPKPAAQDENAKIIQKLKDTLFSTVASLPELQKPAEVRPQFNIQDFFSKKKDEKLPEVPDFSDKLNGDLLEKLIKSDDASNLDSFLSNSNVSTTQKSSPISAITTSGTTPNLQLDDSNDMNSELPSFLSSLTENLSDMREPHCQRGRSKSILDEEFKKYQFIDWNQAEKLGALTGMSPKQVKVWFQNNRAKNNTNPTNPKFCYNADAKKLLLGEFQLYQYPSAAQIEVLANKTGSTERQVKVWFQNQRAAEKRKRYDTNTIQSTSSAITELQNIRNCLS